jgi:mRNA interferase YafQ
VLKIKREKTFLKDLRKTKMTDEQYGKFILYISKLINKEMLPKEAKDHSLTGEWKDVREFHIGGDLVVLYKIESNGIILIRIGCHAQVFKKF